MPLDENFNTSFDTQWIDGREKEILKEVKQRFRLLDRYGRQDEFSYLMENLWQAAKTARKLVQPDPKLDAILKQLIAGLFKPLAPDKTVEHLHTWSRNESRPGADEKGAKVLDSERTFELYCCAVKLVHDQEADRLLLDTQIQQRIARLPKDAKQGAPDSKEGAKQLKVPSAAAVKPTDFKATTAQIEKSLVLHGGGRQVLSRSGYVDAKDHKLGIESVSDELADAIERDYARVSGHVRLDSALATNKYKGKILTGLKLFCHGAIRAHDAVNRASRGDATERARLATWFGTNEKYLLVARRNICKLQEAIQTRPITVAVRVLGTFSEERQSFIDELNGYNAGLIGEELLKNAEGKTLSFKEVEVAEEGMRVYFGLVHNVLHVKRSGDVEAKHFGRGMRILLSEEMVSGTSTGKCMLEYVGGTLYHELSHKVLNTDDVETELQDKSGTIKGVMYSTSKCRLLAQLKPELAVDNADNYRKFVEEFLPGGADNYPL